MSQRHHLPAGPPVLRGSRFKAHLCGAPPGTTQCLVNERAEVGPSASSSEGSVRPWPCVSSGQGSIPLSRGLRKPAKETGGKGSPSFRGCAPGGKATGMQTGQNHAVLFQGKQYKNRVHMEFSFPLHTAGGGRANSKGRATPGLGRLSQTPPGNALSNTLTSTHRHTKTTSEKSTKSGY